MSDDQEKPVPSAQVTLSVVQPSAPEAPKSPAPQESAVQETVVKVATSLQDKVGNWLKDIYNTNKILFYTIIPIAGLVYLIIKYHDLLIDILLNSSKTVMKDEQEKDAKLKAQADASKAAGDALVDQAKSEPSKETPTTDDWFKK